jgi:hypothetical protein
VSEGVGEWRSLGAAKNAKFAKASNLRKTPLFDFDSKNPTNREKPFAAVALKLNMLDAFRSAIYGYPPSGVRRHSGLLERCGSSYGFKIRRVLRRCGGD